MKALFRSAGIAVALAVAACSSPAPSTPSLTPSASGTRAPKDIEITVRDRKVSPPPGRVEVVKGQQVRLVVRSDTPDQVHVHGYDIEKTVNPGQEAVIEFTADKTGVFEVETHQSDLLLTQLVVR